LTARNELLKGNPKADALIKPAQELLGKLDALEEKLHNPKAQVAYDILAQRGGAQLYSQFGFLFESVKDNDGPPTQGVHEVYAEHAQTLQRCGTELNGLLSGDLTRLNEMAKSLAIPNVILSGTAASKKP
jgi:hypothetical protein